MSVNDEDESDPESHRRQDAHSPRAALIGLVVCLVLVLGGLFLVYTLKKMSDASGLRDGGTHQLRADGYQ